MPTQSRPPVLQSHLPSLDGMRAISILLVLASHISGTINILQYEYVSYLGWLGVSVFFVISGLLITWLMIRERDATGAFSLKDFYIRRFLRILPVFWLLLVTVSVLKSAHLIRIEWIDIFRAFTFTHNYPLKLDNSADYAWWLHHTWSLSLEEQFYLVWPILFALLPRRFSPRLAVLLVVAGPLLRVLNFYFLPALRGAEWGTFQTRIDILMAGCASAFLLESPVWNVRIKKIPVWPTLTVTSIFLFVANPLLTYGLPLHSLADTIIRLTFPTIEAFAIALTLLVVVAGKYGLAYRALNSRVPTHLGRLSYSLYIWQELFLAPYDVLGIFSWPWRLLSLYPVAYCSFNFLERPFVRLRSRFRHGVAV